MLASLALVSLLQVPAVGADGLALANPHMTYGLLGPARTDTTVKPGESVVLAFDIQGINVDFAGKATYTTAVEVTDATGKSLFKQPPRKFQEFLPLGGNTVPAFAQVDLAIDAPAGKNTMTVTVTDGSSGKSATTTQDFTIAAPGFSVVHFAVAGDPDGVVPIGAYSVGQPFWVHAAVVGFSRGGTAKQPKISVELRVLDEGGKALGGAPFTGTIDKDVPASAATVPIRFFVPLNRAGSFNIQLTAKDELGGGPATVTVPITVLPRK